MTEQRTRMFLVRHGATSSNLQRPYVLQGRHVNHSLSDTGKEQARCVARVLSEEPIRAVYCSELLRAHETATAIGEHHQLVPTVVEGLHEIDVGSWEGRSWVDIEQNDPEAYMAFIAAPGTTPYFGGESYAAVLERVEPVMRRLLEKHVGETIVVVAHNVVNRAYLAHVMGLDMNRAKFLHQSNCGVNIIDFSPEVGSPQLITLNAAGHIPRSLGV